MGIAAGGWHGAWVAKNRKRMVALAVALLVLSGSVFSHR
jgi:hypothetical protein